MLEICKKLLFLYVNLVYLESSRYESFVSTTVAVYKGVRTSTATTDIVVTATASSVVTPAVISASITVIISIAITEHFFSLVSYDKAIMNHNI